MGLTFLYVAISSSGPPFDLWSFLDIVGMLGRICGRMPTACKYEASREVPLNPVIRHGTSLT